MSAPAAGSRSVQYGDWLADGGIARRARAILAESTLTPANLGRLGQAWANSDFQDFTGPFLDVAGLVIFNATIAGTASLEAVDAVTGQAVWVRSGDSAGGMVADGSTLFAAPSDTAGGRLPQGVEALDLATGQLRWFSPEPDQAAYYPRAAMAVGGGRVFAGFSEGFVDYIAAFNETTGAVQWHTPAVYQGGVSYTGGQLLTAAAGSFGGIRSLNPATGAVSWQGSGALDSPPAVIDGAAITWSVLSNDVQSVPVAQCVGKSVCPATGLRSWAAILPASPEPTGCWWPA